MTMKKWVAAACLCAAAGVSAACVDLNGAWRLDFFPQPDRAPVRTLPLRVPYRTVSAVVPGVCEMDLVRAGLLPAPEKGLNASAFRAYEGHQWLYTKTFELPPQPEEIRATLVFDGVDTLADVFLNGEKIGETANMLIPHRFDVSTRLRAGTNTVAVLIRSALLEARDLTLGQWGRRHPAGGGDGDAFRKAAHMGGWDIFPRLYTSGLWRGVSLLLEPPERIDQPSWLVTKLDPAARTAFINIQARVRAPFSRLDVCSLRYSLARDGKRVWSVTRPFVAFQTYLEKQPVSDLALWWPRGWGAQPLYDAAIELVAPDGRVLAKNVTRIGFRTIRLEYEDNYGPEKPGVFLFRVNGQPCYIRGTNWVPLDAVPGRRESKIEETLALVEDLNCNLVRVWGGGIYESDRFYDLCDEKGLMVWQDFMTASQPSPQTDAYAAATRAEAVETVIRLRNHPSIALWSGNNEIDWSYVWSPFLVEGRRIPSQDRHSRRTLPDVLREYDAARDFLPSSPYFTDDVFLGKAKPAEEHLWGARGYYKVPGYTNAPCWFASEMGYHGCPSRASIEEMMTPACVEPWTNPDVADWQRLEWNREWQFKASNPYDHPGSYAHPKRNALMTKQVALMFGKVPRTLDAFAQASQIVQSEALKTFIELFRSRKFTRMNGLVWWNVRDGWPQISDAVVDYYGRRKRAYETIKNVQGDQLVLVRDDGGVFAVNDRLHPVQGSVRVTDRVSGAVLFEKSYTVPANAALQIGRVSWKGQGLLDLVYEQDGEKRTNWFLYGEIPFDLSAVTGWLDGKPAVATEK